MLAIAIAAVLSGCGEERFANDAVPTQVSGVVQARQADIFRWFMPTPPALLPKVRVLAVPAVPPDISDDASDASWEGLICSYGWDCATALRVFRCESGLTADAISPDGRNIGIAQINLVHGYSVQYLLDARNNLAVAYALYLDQGWAPWSCY